MGYVYQLEVYKKMVKVDLYVQFKISVMKRMYKLVIFVFGWMKPIAYVPFRER